MDKNEYKNKMLFIVGRGRSGTTLLQSILNSNDKIAVAEEAQFIMLLRKKYFKTKWDIERVIAFYEDLWLESRLKNWDIEESILREELISFSNNPTYADLCSVVYAHNARLQGKINGAVLGDKNPHYALYIGKLIEIYPNAKFIHILRDYRDTIMSYKNVDFDPNSTAALACRWNLYNKEVLHYKDMYPEKFITLKFENLLSEPEKSMKLICEFLEIDYNPSMMNFYENKGDNYWNKQWQPNIVCPIDKGHVFIWKKKMADGDVRIADSICAEMADKLGYEPKYRSHPFSLRIKNIPGVLYGRLLTFLEKLIYYIPLQMTASIIRTYRIMTKSLDK